MSGFKLQHGKRHVTRDGRVTDGVVLDVRIAGSKSSDPFFACIGGSYFWFKDDGRYLAGKETVVDLVAEYVEPQPPRYEPFGPDDMPSLLGRHIREKSWDKSCIATIDYVANDFVVFNAGADRLIVFPAELLDDYELIGIATLNGTPCGKLVRP